MERDGAGKAEPIPNSRVTQPTTRFTSPLVINSASRRRSLFSRPRPKEDPARPTSSGSVSDPKVASPSGTRIPRLAQRPPFTLSDAYQLAEYEEEAAQGSPSPAPRLWRSRRESVEQRTAKPGSPTASDARQRGGLSRQPSGLSRRDSHDEPNALSQQSDHSDSTFDEKLRQYARDKTSPEEPGRRSNGLFSRSRLGTKIVETGKGLLVRKSSRNSLDTSSSPRIPKATTSSPSLLQRLSGIRPGSSDASSAREPLDWAHPGKNAHDDLPQSGAILPGLQTPNRSFAWQTEADFTAGDLQVSDSPPVAVGRYNTKIDEIRALEAEVNGRFSQTTDIEPENNARIDAGRARETSPAPNPADDAVESDRAARSDYEVAPDSEDRIPSHRPASRASMRMSEPRSREIEGLSKRALATARLDEFRERNIRTSRSPSPDIAQKTSQEPIRAFSPLRDRLRRQENRPWVATRQTEEGRAAESALAPALPGQHHSPDNTAHASHNRALSWSREARHSGSQTKDEAGDVLHRLAAASSSSPAPEAQVPAESQSPATRDRDQTERARQRRLIGGTKGVARPTVGFAGLSRTSSVESNLAKRASFVHSDSDPTERIEGEMNLFAPQENQSERGSLRVPSPEPEEEAPNETPRPIKLDPLTQPTPRVTGAFVETPATVKVEKPESPSTGPVDELHKNGRNRPSADSSGEPKPPIARDGKDGVKGRQEQRTQSSRGDRPSGRSSSVSARRRARSLSRSRTPLINSARLPTVRGDLLEIQRANQIDDSTLDDVADLLIPHVPSSRGGKPEPAKNDSLKKLDREELEAYGRMSRSLETGLLGIRVAKEGITRLEKKVADSGIQEHPQHTAHSDSPKEESSPCPSCRSSRLAADAPVTYVHLPLPRLWHRQENFRFTFLGLSLFILSLWYIAESWMCFQYCKPEYCYPGTPCDWSPEDPDWGFAIPMKLDQWTSGGMGGRLVRRIRPEVEDWLADIWDAATGTDITAVDTSRYGWEKKRQHRRRLAKKGLGKPFVARQEDQAVLSGWKSVREASEKAQRAREMGYEVIDEYESIGGDEKL